MFTLPIFTTNKNSGESKFLRQENKNRFPNYKSVKQRNSLGSELAYEDEKVGKLKRMWDVRSGRQRVRPLRHHDVVVNGAMLRWPWIGFLITTQRERVFLRARKAL